MTAKCFAVMVLMCPCGFLLGYGFGLACGMDQITCRTISMETGIQQVGIAGAIAIQSFEDDQLDRTIVVMVMFGVATVIFGALWALILRKAFDPPAAKLDPAYVKAKQLNRRVRPGAGPAQAYGPIAPQHPPIGPTLNGQRQALVSASVQGPKCH